MFCRSVSRRFHCGSALLGQHEFNIQNKGPLNGIKILDLTRVLAGPYCTMLLGDLGADVVKVEEPQRGDDTRAWGPPWTASGDSGDERLSAYFVAVNRNKRSLAVDLKRPEGHAVVKELAKQCDILIHNFLPRTCRSLQLEYERMAAVNDRLVYVAISGYGLNGPDRDKPGYDVIIEAEAGLMHITGAADGPPVKVGVAMTDLTTGLYAHGAIMAALLARNQNGGRGQRVDLSLLECQLASLVNIGSNYLVSGQEASRMGTAHASIVPYQVFETENGGGHIMIGAGNDAQFAELCDRMELRELNNDKRFSTNANRVANRVELVDLLQRRFNQKTTAAWMERLAGSKIPAGPVNNIAQTFQLPQLAHQAMIQQVQHPKIGPIKVVGPPVKYSNGGANIRLPPPLLGEHSDVVLAEWLDYSPERISELRRTGAIK